MSEAMLYKKRSLLLVSLLCSYFTGSIPGAQFCLSHQFTKQECCYLVVISSLSLHYLCVYLNLQFIVAASFEYLSSVMFSMMFSTLLGTLM